jgi:hypothetical protein
MKNRSEAITEKQATLADYAGWLFGGAVLAAGFVNTFWGNDPGFGIFLVFLSFVYYPPVNALVKEKLDVTIPLFVKLLLGIFLIWASVGVGELQDKINLMMLDLN